MHMQLLESRLFLSANGTTPAEGDWGSGNWFWQGGNGQIFNESESSIYVYVTNHGWKELPPGKHTPAGSDADAWTTNPDKVGGPRDDEGNPWVYKVQNGDKATVVDHPEGGVKNDWTRTDMNDGSGIRYPEEIGGKHPNELPPGHNGTPDSNLGDLENPEKYVRGDDFNWWYDDEEHNPEGKQNPNSPGYRPPYATPAEDIFEEADEDEHRLIYDLDNVLCETYMSNGTFA